MTTPTKQTDREKSEKSEKKATPKKETKEEKKELKASRKSGDKSSLTTGRKSEVSSDLHSSTVVEEQKEPADIESLPDMSMIDTERESKLIIDYVIEHVLVGCRKEIKQDDS